MCKGLLGDNAKLNIYDPEVSEQQILTDLATPKFEWDHPSTIKAQGEALKQSVEIFKEPYAALAGTHALCVLTEWDEFRSYDYQKIYDSMVKPAFAFDGRNILDHQHLRELGFIVYALGKPLDPFIQKNYN